MPLERDEGEYAYAGQLLLQGIPPYVMVYNMKFPGIYMAYAGLMKLFGESGRGIHIGFILVNGFSIVLVYLLGVRLFNRRTGVTAAAIFAYGSLTPALLGTAAHATHFVLLPALGGLLLLLKGIEQRSTPWLFGSGVALGVSMLMKQHGIFFVVCGAAYGLFHLISEEGLGRKAIWRACAAYVSGVALPLIGTGIWLWKAGVFGKFWYWCIDYARYYAVENSGPAQIVSGFFTLTPRVIFFITACALVGLVIIWRAGSRAVAWFGTIFLICSILSIFPGFNFRPHYYVMLLPAVCLLTGVLVDQVSTYLAVKKSGFQARVPAVVVIVLLALGLRSDGAILFNNDPVQACRFIYGLNPFPESIPIAEYLKTHASREDRLAVIGSEPQIYFYSRLHSATGFIYTYALMEPQPHALEMQYDMIKELEATKPEYIIFVKVPTSWLARRKSHATILHWADRFVSSDYELVGIVDLAPERSSYYWDKDAKGRIPECVMNLCVFKRK
jgi:Dolichyl-phosphate-mannose-protein mannosyltransferase